MTNILGSFFTSHLGRTKIQIAERVFYFVLPPAPIAQIYNSDGELDSGESLGETDEEEESESLGSSGSDEESSGLSSMEEESDEDEKEQRKEAELKKRPKLVLKKKPVPPSRGGKGKGKHQGKTIWAGKGKMPAKHRKGEGDEDEEDEEDEDEEMEDAEEEEEEKKGGKGSSKKAKPSTSKKEAKGKIGSAETATASRKRKRGDTTDQEQETALKVGTPIGIEALNLKPKKKKKAAAAETSSATDQTASTSSTSGPPGKGKGKGGGKAHIVAAAMAAKAKSDEQRSTGKSTTPVPSATGSTSSATTSAVVAPVLAASTIKPIAANPLRPIGQPTSSTIINSTSRPPSIAVRPSTPATTATSGSNTGGSGVRPPVPALHQTQARPLTGTMQSQRPIASTHQGTASDLKQASVPRPPINGVTQAATSLPAAFPPSAAAFAHLTNPKPQAAATQPLPPAGAGVKPELSNMELIKNALANSTSDSRGGKLTLQEIYEDITGKYEWYRNNNRANGRDWHSSIRHAVGSSRDMVRIPRKANEQGKGIFYALNSSEAAKLYRIESGNNAAVNSPAVHASTPTTAPARTTPAVAVVSPSANPAAVPIAPSVSPTPPVVTAPPSRPPMPATPRPARPSPPIQSNGRVTIVIGKAPAEALAQMAAVPKAAITQSIESLFGGPPIVHHEGKLYLSPVVFGHMSASEISDIGGKGAAQALALLQSQLVKHLQSKMTAGRGGPVRPARPPGAATTATQAMARPAAPMSRPRPPAANTINGAASSNTARPMAVSNAQQMRPVQNRPAPGQTTGMQVSRPSGSPSIATQSPRPLNVPSSGSNNQAHAVGNGNVSGPPHQGVRPAGAPMQSRPPQAQGQTMPIRPPGTASLSPNLVRPQRPPPPTIQGTPAYRPSPVIASPSPQPIGGPAAATSAPQTTASAPLQSQQTTPAPPRPPMGPASGFVRPATVSATATANPIPAPVVTTSTVLSPAPASAPPSSNAMMSAMQALASHPDAAGLMPLLSGGKMESGTKLTPSQLELLQRVGRIAEEQQRAQQQKRDQSQVNVNSIGNGNVSSSPSSTTNSSVNKEAESTTAPPSQNHTPTTSSNPSTTLAK